VTSDQMVNVNSAELWVSVAESADYGRTVADIRRVVGSYPGLRRTLLTYQQERLAAAETGPKAPLVVRVFGEDLRVLRAKAEEVRRTVAEVDGVVDSRVEAQVEEPTLQVQVDLAAAERHGIKPGDVRRAAATLLSGLLVGNLYEQQKVFDVVVWGTVSTRHNLASVGNLLIDTPAGRQVRLRDVASVRVAPYPTVIEHDDVSRSLDVTADIKGRSLGAVDREVESRIRALRYPLEYHAEVVGDVAARQGADRRILGLALGALVGIFLLLQAATASWRMATLLILLIPLGGVGGVLTASVAGGFMSAGALMGLLLVLGVVTRNCLVLVSRYQRRAEEGQPPGPDLVRRATLDTVVPVLLTALATAAALLPFVVFGNLAGEEILHPLAVVALGGLVTSTLVTLFVVPALYLRLTTGGKPSRPIPSLPQSRSPVDLEEAHHAQP